MRKDIWKKAERFWNLPGKWCSKGSHSKLNWLWKFLLLTTSKCWWGTFSYDFSDHLHYSTCDWFTFQPLQILYQVVYFSWASSSAKEHIGSISYHQRGHPKNRRAGAVKWTKVLIPTPARLWTHFTISDKSVRIFQCGYLMLDS